jgi:hypothetical protein
MDTHFLIKQVELYGIKGAAKNLDLTYYQCRDRYYRVINK